MRLSQHSFRREEEEVFKKSTQAPQGEVPQTSHVISIEKALRKRERREREREKSNGRQKSVTVGSHGRGTHAVRGLLRRIHIEDVRMQQLPRSQWLGRVSIFSPTLLSVSLTNS